MNVTQIDYVSSSSDIMANIFSRLDRKTNCTNARVCKAWNLPATRSIWRRSDPKIFLALGEATVNAFGTISFNHHPTAQQWTYFKMMCQYVEYFDDDPYGQRLNYWFKHVLLQDENAPTILFPNLRVLSLAINNVQAFNAPSVTTLSLVLSPELVLQDRRQMASIIRHLPTSLPNVTTLTVLGPPQVHKYTEETLRICHAFKSIKSLVFSPSMINFRVLQSIASIRTLSSIDVTEYYVPARRSIIIRNSKATIGPNGLKFTRLSFLQLQKIAVTVEGFTHFHRLLSTRNFPTRSLTSLWARFDTGHSYSADNIYSIFENVVKHCRSLQILTLRFCPPYTINMHTIDKVEVIHYSDFRSFLSLPHLVEFSIDHTLPLSITESDILHLASHISQYRLLWLNPYPAIVIQVDDWSIPPLQALRHFSAHCPMLTHLGILLDAQGRIPQMLHFPRFPALQELFVGRSTIPHLTGENEQQTINAWEGIARVLGELLPSSAKLTTVHDYQNVYNPQTGAISGRMRIVAVSSDEKGNHSRRSIAAWNAVRGMSYQLS